MSTSPTIAYLAGQKLLIRGAGQPPREITSAFGQEIINRATQRQQAQGWKNSGNSESPFGGAMLWGGEQVDPSLIPIRFVSLARGADNHQLTYLLDTGTVGGLLSYDVTAKREQRLFHRAEFQAHDLAMSPSRDRLACSVSGQAGVANLAVMDADGKNLREVTEGDTIDRAPNWVPGEPARLVYQSAGIGRNAEGYPVAEGPSSIESLDLESGDLQTLLEDDDRDFLAPHLDSDGTLYVIERPYEHLGSYSPLRVLLDIVLFPFRLLRAIFSFLNVFSMFFSGKPLTTAGRKTTSKDADEVARMVFWGKLIDTRKQLRGSKKDKDGGLVPKDWLLRRQGADGELETLASGVAAYDLLPDGGIVYTNGRHVYRLSADGQREKMFSDHGIHWLIALEGL